jgi:hypothetical protein
MRMPARRPPLRGAGLLPGRRMELTTKNTKMQVDELPNRVIGCAIEVHRVLGPGLLESTCVF